MIKLNYVPHSMQLEDIAKGKHDRRLVTHAKGAAEFGKQYGGFFMTTMEESNGNWYYWGQNSKFIPAWRHIWQIFEDQGANQYATWVWEPVCREGFPNAMNAEHFYRGDQYVDWIGLSFMAMRSYTPSDGTFDGLMSKTYEQMRKQHPQKPLMQAEFGKSRTWDQPRWLIDAYKSIKTMPGMKAAIYYDNVTQSLNDDHTLSEKSLQTMKEIFKDPYWIMAK